MQFSFVILLLALLSSCTSGLQLSGKSDSQEAKASSQVENRGDRPTDSSEGLPGYMIQCSFFDDNVETDAVSHQLKCQWGDAEGNKADLPSIAKEWTWSQRSAPETQTLVSLTEIEDPKWHVVINVDQTDTSLARQALETMVVNFDYTDLEGVSQSQSRDIGDEVQKQERVEELTQLDDLASRIETFLINNDRREQRVNSFRTGVNGYPDLLSAVNTLYSQIQAGADITGQEYQQARENLNNAVTSLNVVDEALVVASLETAEILIIIP
ncbi:hypothetical protein [Pseudobacteriovorax antillogorgiicola]|uniref:Uncharacterized protein n=1 Tax=Pseudobacteriovorax antillogorgiicola TaxID=1513793 RepID=A0A1Y6CRQ2_9BACT|nr:hypothetical protein [Pseudobacteriovorax antillogorgiicola]TCS45897.1 hypothetical protein EDD56_12660 [Pseudobacteriovorax antillogorgiicola]SMF71148.1 hypothetical protein SAMN06296036_12638 [Pseudobacteriovorax antillogorgiicola]